LSHHRLFVQFFGCLGKRGADRGLRKDDAECRMSFSQAALNGTERLPSLEVCLVCLDMLPAS
jgi:hypothetical protein